MIELEGGGPLLAHLGSIGGVDSNQVRVNSDGLQHATHKIRFVFAISVLVGEDIGGLVRYIATAVLQVQFNSDVADILHVAADGANFAIVRLGAGCELSCLGGNLGSDGVATLGERGLPARDIVPGIEGRNNGARTAGWNKRDG